MANNDWILYFQEDYVDIACLVRLNEKVWKSAPTSIQKFVGEGLKMAAASLVPLVGLIGKLAVTSTHKYARNPL